MAIFASRRVNVDPFPYVGEHGSRHAYPGTLNQKRLEFDPRPEFDNVVNPILADYRTDCEHTTWGRRNPLDWMNEAANPDTWPGVVFPFSDDAVKHARRVLQKLVAFRAGSE